MIVYRKINGINFGVRTEHPATLLCDKESAEKTKGDIYTFIEYLYLQKNIFTPMIATWEITNVCNFECRFCYINTEKKSGDIYFRFDRLKGVIDDLAEQGLLLVYITGGEVFTHPDFEEIYTYLKEKGIFVVILSNLSLLKENHIELFKKLPPLRITSSIYAMSPERFTSVTGREGGVCNKVLDNIILLRNNGINVTCQTPVNRLTVGDYRSISEWCYTNGIIYKSDNANEDSYYGESRDDYTLDREEFLKIKSQLRFHSEEVISSDEKPEKKFGYRCHFNCISGRHTFAISYDLTLRPCFSIYSEPYEHFSGQVSMKNALLSLKEYIEDKKKQRIDYCSGCEAYQICSECPLTQNRHKDDPADYMKKKCAENRRKIMDL